MFALFANSSLTLYKNIILPKTIYALLNQKMGHNKSKCQIISRGINVRFNFYRIKRNASTNS